MPWMIDLSSIPGEVESVDVGAAGAFSVCSRSGEDASYSRFTIINVVGSMLPSLRSPDRMFRGHAETYGATRTRPEINKAKIRNPN
jgi:hypothetical protein